METHAHLEKLALPELVDRLEDLDGRRTPVGWTPDDAVERATIERCILALVSAPAPNGDRALATRLEIKLRSKEQTVPAEVREVRVGGVLVRTQGTFVVGTHVDMHFHVSETDDHGQRARGVITSLETGAVLISVSDQPSEAHERRRLRFILELIRHRVHD
jgi:hypothetical protein